MELPGVGVYTSQLPSGLGGRCYEAAIGTDKDATIRREGGDVALSNQHITCVVMIVCSCFIFYTD